MTREDVACSYRGRFAPSPTGQLHFGSLVAALASWLCARAAGGAWMIRIDDLDREREVPGATDHILATLAAFGFASDEAVIRQSRRDAVHAEALQRLRDADLVYPCWCSRADLAAFDGIHPAACVASAESARAPAWRLRVADATIAFDDAIQGSQQQDLKKDVGDFVVWRNDGGCAYQLAVVVDDAAQSITDVVRGADLLDSTPRQILLQRLLALPTPRYAHIPLALDAEGRKLGKQQLALPVDGADPMPALRAALAFLGQPASDECHPAALLSGAVRRFDASRIPRSASAPAPLRQCGRKFAEAAGTIAATRKASLAFEMLKGESVMTARVALVTGGTGGIGTAICRHLATLGHKVATNYRDEAKTRAWQDAQRKDGFEFAIAQGDVADAASSEAMVREVERQLGPVDILINNAGITRDTTFHKMSALQWQEVIATNLGSCFNVTRPIIDGMRARKWGRIVQISSINGQKGQYGQANYAAAKAGMHGFTISLAQENAKFGITVNTVSPGYVGTDMVMAVPEDVRAKIVAQIPIGRLGDPDEIAYAVAFFAADQATWITGANLAINGGQYMGW